jgi:hypothetical protein
MDPTKRRVQPPVGYSLESRTDGARDQPPPYRPPPPPTPFTPYSTGDPSSSTTDDIFASLQVAWQWDPKNSKRYAEAEEELHGEDWGSPSARLPAVAFVSIPGRLTNTRLFLYDRGNLPLPTGAVEPVLMAEDRMMICLNSSSACFKIGGLQDGITAVILSRFLLRVANIHLAGAVCRSRGMWCVALQNPLEERAALMALHERFWFTPLGIIDVSGPKAAAEVNVLLTASRHDARTKGYPRHLMTVTYWSPNTPAPPPQ